MSLRDVKKPGVMPSTAPGCLACHCYSSTLVMVELNAVLPGGVCGLSWPKGWPSGHVCPSGHRQLLESACAPDCVYNTDFPAAEALAVENTWASSRKCHGTWRSPCREALGPGNRQVVFFFGKKSKFCLQNRRVMGGRTRVKVEVWLAWGGCFFWTTQPLMVPDLLRIQYAEGPSEGCFDLHGLEVWRGGLPG